MLSTLLQDICEEGVDHCVYEYITPEETVYGISFSFSFFGEMYQMGMSTKFYYLKIL